VNIGGDYEIGRSVCPCVYVSVCPCTLDGDIHSYERLLVYVCERVPSVVTCSAGDKNSRITSGVINSA